MRLSLLALVSLVKGSTSAATSSVEHVSLTMDQEGIEFPTRSLQESSCYGDYPFSLYFKGECNLESFIDRLEIRMEEVPCHNSPMDEIASLLDLDPFNITAIENTVMGLCRTAMDNFASDPNSSVSWDKVTNKGDQFDKSYFDGGTYWNEEYQTDYDSLVPEQPSNVLEKDTERVEDLYETVAERRQFEFPSHLKNFESCEIRSAMCCWVQDRQANDNNGNCNTPYDENCIDKDPADNTDLCAVDFERSGSDSSHIPGGPGFAVYPKDNNEGEGAVHCHGFAWALDDYDLQSRFKGNNLFYVSMYDHMSERGYVRNVPGAPMCGCVEKMPIVTRADCTEIEALEIWKLEWDASSGLRVSLDHAELSFNACNSKGNGANNNLEDFYKRLKKEGRASEKDFDILRNTLVAKTGCDEAVHNLFYEKGYELNPALSDWSQVYGRGQYEYPDNTFIELWAHWSPTSHVVEPIFYVRRLCHSCHKDSHRDITYKRLTPVPESMDVRNLFLDSWISDGNLLGVDFNLFSSVEDALSDTNPWQFCNYDDQGIGFPRDCGPTGAVHGEWNSLYRGGETDFAFFVWNNNPNYDAPSYTPTVSPAPNRDMEIPGAEGHAKRLDDSLGYMLAYEVNLEQTGDKNNINYQQNGNVYSTDVHNQLPHYLPDTGFERIAYYMELYSDEYGPQWIWVSMDAFTDNLDKIGVPTFDSGFFFDGEVSGLNVYSSVDRLNGMDMTGRIEFWPTNYASSNKHGIEGASSSKYDYSDERHGGGNYGSMQIHSLDLKETLFAFNYWNTNSGPPDMGIGNNPDLSDNPDWTFSKNMNIYLKKKLQVFVRGPATLTPTISNVPTKTATPTRLMSEEFNIALGRPTEQSCSLNSYYESSLAVDGNEHSFTHTCNHQKNEWWKVHLEPRSIINKIVILNRIDCCQNRLDYAKVEILDENGEVVSLENVGQATKKGAVVLFYNGGIEASMVRVVVNNQNPLSLAEVRVYGHTPATRSPTFTPTVSQVPTSQAYAVLSDTINLAIGGTATQSTTCYEGEADRAIDGHTNGNFSGYPHSVTHTCREGTNNNEYAWWVVYLPREDDIIKKITVWNRMDCCSDRLEDSLVQILDADGKVIAERQIGPSFNIENFEFDFDSVIGAAIRVMMTNEGELSIAEVIVEGKRHIGV